MNGPEQGASLLQRSRRAGSKFQNPVPTKLGGFGMAAKVIPMMLRNRAETEPREPVGPFRTDPDVYTQAPRSGLRVTWFGHSSTLLEIDGMRVLLDPVWEERASPVQWVGPRRFFAPTLALEMLPPLDAVLVSHDHYDHFGAGTLRSLARLRATAAAKWITSLGVGRRLRQCGVPGERIAELDWTESALVESAAGGRLVVDAWPARHFSGRGLHDRNTTLWSSFVLEGARHRVFFGADSGYWDGFAEIGAQYPRFDMTMLEIGAFHPLWAGIHLGPEGALRAYQALGGAAKAGWFMPIHWGLFNLALHGWREPIETLERAAQEAGAPLFSPEPGLPTEAGEGGVAAWWRGAERQG